MNKGVDRPRKMNRRALERRQTRQHAREFHGVINTGQPFSGRRPAVRSSDRDKRELMTAARRAGWRGRTFKGAKRFERRLERAS
jgi:hypothetical protein